MTVCDFSARATCYVELKGRNRAKSGRIDLTLKRCQHTDTKSMEKKIQGSSLLLGVAAFGSYALVMATFPRFALPGAVFAVLIAFLTGFAQASACRFFGGVTLAVGCWISLGLVLGTASERSSAIVIVPVVLLTALGLGAIGFFAGQLIGKAAKAARTNRIAK